MTKAGSAVFGREALVELPIRPNLLHGGLLFGSASELPDGFGAIKRGRGTLLREALQSIFRSLPIDRQTSDLIAIADSALNETEQGELTAALQNSTGGQWTLLSRAVALAAAYTDATDVELCAPLPVLDVSADAISLSGVERTADGVLRLVGATPRLDVVAPLELVKALFRECALRLRERFNFDFRRVRGGAQRELAIHFLDQFFEGEESLDISRFSGREGAVITFAELAAEDAPRLMISEWEKEIQASLRARGVEEEKFIIEQRAWRMLQRWVPIVRERGVPVMGATGDAIALLTREPWFQQTDCAFESIRIAPQSSVEPPEVQDDQTVVDTEESLPPVPAAGRVYRQAWLTEKIAPDAFSIFGRVFVLEEGKTVFSTDSGADIVQLPAVVLGGEATPFALVKTRASGSTYVESLGREIRINGAEIKRREAVFVGDILEVSGTGMVIQFLAQVEESL